jgi:type III secretory pathway component EscS
VEMWICFFLITPLFPHYSAFGESIYLGEGLFVYSQALYNLTMETETKNPVASDVRSARSSQEGDLKDEVLESIPTDQVPLQTFIEYAKLERELEEIDYDKHKGRDVDQGRLQELIDELGLRDEIAAANRALRMATWFNIFTLITTDILGPQKAPWAFAQLGFIPASLIYVAFGGVATYAALLLTHMYLRLSSSKFPLRNYSELAPRAIGGIVGRYLKFLMDGMQILQFVFQLSGLILQNGQALSQMAHGSACFSGVMFAFAAAGMVINQIRSLTHLSKLTTFNFCINLLVLFATMGVVAHSAPNYLSAHKNNGVSGTKVVTELFAKNSMSQKFVGAMNISYAYGGAMLFVEFMAEMRRPRDFWKGLICAQSIIIVVYLIYGIVIYYYQGQFSINPANQGISLYKWQTAMNALILFTQFVSAAIYCNVAVKVIYRSIIEGVFHGPSMVTKRGRIIFSVSVVIFYAVSYVLASAIPQFSNVTGFFAAILMVPFSYLYPSLLVLILRVREDGLIKGFNSIQLTNPHWWKAILWNKWYLKTLDFIIVLGSLICMGMGSWSSIIAMVQTFKEQGASTSFGCEPPV